MKAALPRFRRIVGAAARLAAAAGLGALASLPAHAETRALLAGTWKFDTPAIPNLVGPENDLAAMETLVRNQGITDVTVLRNDQVTRTTMETALHALGLRARPGDSIVLYYSGHGAQAEAAVKGTRDGDLDQFLPLAGFDPDAQDVERFIVDKDFYDWLARYIPPGVRVLMIADTCHSGTMNRSLDPRSFHFTPRVALRAVPDMKLIPRPAPRFASVLATARDASAPIDRADLPNVVFLAAAQDEQFALETALPDASGPSRGLLTYSFEQGMTRAGPDGKTLLADLNGDGKVDIGEIAVYLDGQVRTLSAQRQQPRATFAAPRAAEPVFAAATAPPAPAPPPPAPPLPRIFAADAKAQAMLRQPEAPWVAVASAERADFLWDFPQATLVRRTGDAVAQGVAGSAALRGVIEKWNAVEALRPFLNESRGRLALSPQLPGTRYAPGAQVSLAYAAQPGAPAGYATVFDLASDGTVQVLYPTQPEDGDGRLEPAGTLPLMKTRVVAPYGADHVLALVTPTPPREFRAMLRSIDNQRAAARLVDPVRALLAAAPGKASLSIAELYTGK